MTGQVDVLPDVQRGRWGLAVVLSAGAVSMLGSAMSFVAVPWFVLGTTGSATATGLVSAAAGMGAVVSGWAFGPLLDRLGHRAMAIAGDVTAALAIGAVPLLHSYADMTPLWAIAGLVFAGAAAGMVSSTARQSMLATLSAAAGVSLPRMSAVYWTMQRAALALAAVPVGILLSVLDPLGILWLDAASFLMAAVMLLAGVRAARSPDRDAPSGYLGQLRAGLRFLRRDELVRLILVVAILLAALEAPMLTVIVPSMAAASGPATLSHLVLAYAVGMLAGVAGYGTVGIRQSRRGLAVGCLATVGAGYLLLALPLPVAWKVIPVAMMGVATGPLAPLIVSTVQQRTPSDLLGRVTGALISSIMAAIPFGRAIIGYGIDLVGLPALMLISALCYLGTGWFLLASGRFRQLMAAVAVRGE